jgi:hypothetical protein
LAKKTGIKPGMALATHAALTSYLTLLGPLPADVRFIKSARAKVDMVHIFARSYGELAAQLPRSKARIADDGAIWVSWPKKTSALVSDLSRMQTALPVSVLGAPGESGARLGLDEAAVPDDGQRQVRPEARFADLIRKTPH